MLGVKPTLPNNGEYLDEDFLQLLIDLLEIFGYTIGSGGSGQGSIQDDNIADDAAIKKAKIADVAMVLTDTVNPGVQSPSRATLFTNGSFKLDPADMETYVPGNGDTTLAFTNRKRFKRVTYSGAGAANIDTMTMTGAVEGDIITLIADVTGAGTLATVHTAGGGAGKMNHSGGGAGPGPMSVTAAEVSGTLGTWIYAKFGEAAAQWWQT